MSRAKASSTCPPSRSRSATSVWASTSSRLLGGRSPRGGGVDALRCAAAPRPSRARRRPRCRRGWRRPASGTPRRPGRCRRPRARPAPGRSAGRRTPRRRRRRRPAGAAGSGWCRPVTPWVAICSSTWVISVRSSPSGGASWSSGIIRPCTTSATSGTDGIWSAWASCGEASTSTLPSRKRPSNSSASVSRSVGQPGAVRAPGSASRRPAAPGRSSSASRWAWMFCSSSVDRVGTRAGPVRRPPAGAGPGRRRRGPLERGQVDGTGTRERLLCHGPILSDRAEGSSTQGSVSNRCNSRKYAQRSSHGTARALRSTRQVRSRGAARPRGLAARRRRRRPSSPRRRRRPRRGHLAWSARPRKPVAGRRVSAAPEQRHATAWSRGALERSSGGPGSSDWSSGAAVLVAARSAISPGSSARLERSRHQRRACARTPPAQEPAMSTLYGVLTRRELEVRRAWRRQSSSATRASTTPGDQAVLHRSRRRRRSARPGPHHLAAGEPVTDDHPAAVRVDQKPGQAPVCVRRAKTRHACASRLASCAGDHLLAVADRGSLRRVRRRLVIVMSTARIVWTMSGVIVEGQVLADDVERRPPPRGRTVACGSAGS